MSRTFTASHTGQGLYVGCSLPDLLADSRKAKIVITNYHAFKHRQTMDVSKIGKAPQLREFRALMAKLSTDLAMPERYNVRLGAPLDPPGHADLSRT